MHTPSTRCTQLLSEGDKSCPTASPNSTHTTMHERAGAHNTHTHAHACASHCRCMYTVHACAEGRTRTLPHTHSHAHAHTLARDAPFTHLLKEHAQRALCVTRVLAKAVRALAHKQCHRLRRAACALPREGTHRGCFAAARHAVQQHAPARTHARQTAWLTAAYPALVLAKCHGTHSNTHADAEHMWLMGLLGGLAVSQLGKLVSATFRLCRGQPGAGHPVLWH